MNQEQVYETIKSELSEISRVELQHAIFLILSRLNSNAENIHPEIQAQLDYWKGESFFSTELPPEQRAQKVRESCDFFYEHFKALNLDIPALRGDQLFAENQIGLLDNPIEVRDTMSLYCEYLATLSTKTTEIQQRYFYSFPPTDPTYLQCAGGSRTRIDDILKQLRVSGIDSHLYNAHTTTSANIQEKLKTKLRRGIHIHLIPYVNYALNVEGRDTLAARDHYFLTPQFKITSSSLFHELRNYEVMFKDLLLKNEEFISYLTSKAAEKMQVINNTLANAAQEGHDDVDITSLVEARTETKHQDITAESIAIQYRSSLLQQVGAKQIGDVVELDNDENYQWSEEKLLRLATGEFFANFFTKTATLKEQRPHQDEIDALSQPAGLFSSKTPDNLVTLLNSSSIEEVTIGIEALWTLSENMIINSPLQVVKTVNSLGGATALQEIKSKLTEYPNHQEKIHRINENFDVYVQNPIVQVCLNPTIKHRISLKNLLKVGASTQEIAAHCEITDLKTLRAEYAETETTREEWITTTMVDIIKQRPDFYEIAYHLKEKGVNFGAHSQERILEGFIQKQDADPEQETEKLVHFLRNFVTKELKTRTLIRLMLYMPHKEQIAAKIQTGELNLLRGVTSNIRIYDYVTIDGEVGINNNIDVMREIFVGLAQNTDFDRRASEIKLLTKLGLNPDIKIKQSKGLLETTAAHIAVANNNLEALKLLKECGSTLDQKNQHNKRPIHKAIKEGHTEIFNYLLEDENNVRTKAEKTPLRDYALRPVITTLSSIGIVTSGLLSFILYNGSVVNRDNVIIMRSLFSTSYKSDPSITVEAAKYGRADFLKTLLERGHKAPLVTQILNPNPEISNILRAAQYAEDVAKSSLDNTREWSKDERKEEELRIRTAILKEYDFDAQRIKADFLEPKQSLFERFTPHSLRRKLGHALPITKPYITAEAGATENDVAQDKATTAAVAKYSDEKDKATSAAVATHPTSVKYQEPEEEEKYKSDLSQQPNTTLNPTSGIGTKTQVTTRSLS